jgi:hypothetical protein
VSTEEREEMRFIRDIGGKTRREIIRNKKCWRIIEIKYLGR